MNDENYLSDLLQLLNDDHPLFSTVVDEMNLAESDDKTFFGDDRDYDYNGDFDYE